MDGRGLGQGAQVFFFFCRQRIPDVYNGPGGHQHWPVARHDPEALLWAVDRNLTGGGIFVFPLHGERRQFNTLLLLSANTTAADDEERI